MIVGVALALVIAVFCPQGWQTPLTLVLIALGSVHGAFDLAILIRRFPLLRALLLIGAYALTAALGFLLYRALPALGAALLLILSAWHFGVQQAPPRLRFGTGALLLMWVIALHAPLQYLIADAHFQPPSSPEYWRIVGAALAAATALTWRLWRKRNIAIAVILEWLFWLALVPLMPATLWFGCFFVLQHSREHFKALSKSGYLSVGDIFLAILAVTILALIAGYFRNQITVHVSSRAILDTLLPLWIAPALLGLTIAHSALIDGLKPLRRVSGGE